MSAEWKTFSLPDRAEGIALAGLQDFLRAHQSLPVQLSAAAWRRLDTRLLQYLIAVSQDWTARNLGFVLADVPSPQAAILSLIGVTPDLLTWQEGRA